MKTGGLSGLEGYETVDHPGAVALALPDVVPWVRYTLEGGHSLHREAGRDRGALELPGRAPVWVIPSRGKRGGSHWVVRHFSRGGKVFPFLLGDRFLRLGTPRPFHEVAVSEGARARGVPTPRVLAAAVYPSPPFYRGDLVTEHVQDAIDLVEALFDDRKRGAGGSGERLDSLRAAGGLIRTLSRAGVRHKDLHAGNILLRFRGSSPTPFVLDLDRSEVLPHGGGVDPAPMLRRLGRSIRKWEGRTGLHLTDREWEILERSARE